MARVAPPVPIVLLHGFAGTGRLWDPVRVALGDGVDVRTPDLRGHGERVAARPVSFAGCVEDILEAAPSRFVLGGYSLGGRVALHVALAAPDRVAALVLVATTAGIIGADERVERAAADRALADRIEADGLHAFAERWTTQSLFADDPPAARAAQRADIARSTPAGLAAALRGVGTGEMTPLWDRLGELTMPVRVVVGKRDAKFRALGADLVAALSVATLMTVPGAGHGLPREAPDAVARSIQAAAELMTVPPAGRDRVQPIDPA